MKLIEFKNQFVKSTNINVFKNVCIKLGIGVINGNDVDLNIELTEEQINELKLNTQINKHNINQWIIGKQKNFQDEYINIINYCDNEIKNNMLLDEDKDKLYEIKTAYENQRDFIIKTKKDMYSENARKDHNELYLDSEKLKSVLNSNIIDQKVVDSQNKKIDSFDKKIDEKISELNKLEKEKQLSSSSLMKSIKENKVKHINKKIQKLKNKKGTIQVKQRQIINKNVNKYYEKKKTELEKQKIKFEKEMNYAKEHYEYQSTIDALNSDIEMNNNRNYSNVFKKAASKVENMHLQAEKIKFQIKIAALKVKNGKIKIQDPIKELSAACTM